MMLDPKDHIPDWTETHPDDSEPQWSTDENQIDEAYERYMEE